MIARSVAKPASDFAALDNRLAVGALAFDPREIPSAKSRRTAVVCAPPLYTPPSTGILACSNGETETVSACSATGHSPAYQATCDVTNAGSGNSVNLTCRYFNGF